MNKLEILSLASDIWSSVIENDESEWKEYYSNNDNNDDGNMYQYNTKHRLLFKTKNKDGSYSYTDMDRIVNIQMAKTPFQMCILRMIIDYVYPLVFPYKPMNDHIWVDFLFCPYGEKEWEQNLV